MTRGGETEARAAADAVVVGGGVSGLATAYYLRRELGPNAAVTVLEAAPDPGGKVRTRSFAGLSVDTGPDAYLSRAPELRRLVEELGLAGEVIEPLGGGSYIWSRGRLRPIPPGMAFGLPERLWPLLRSGLLTPLETARAGLDLVLPATRRGPDPTVADLIRPRFGAGVYDRLAAPLLGGVHAGDPAALSARSTVPEIAALAGAGRSMTLTMRRRQRAAAPAPAGRRPAPLVSLRGGMSRLVDRLVEELGPAAVVAGSPATALERHGSGYRVRAADRSYDAARVVLATPAYVTADLIEPLSPSAATTLREIPYVDVANVSLAFPRDRVPDLPPGTGFLVPPAEGELAVGCTWVTQKWPRPAGGDLVVIKTMVGRAGDRRWLTMSDAELVAGVRDALDRMLGLRTEPEAVLIQRWPASMPQYVVGHADRLDRLDAQLRTLPGLAVTGAAYRGVGLAGCVAQAVATATTLSAPQGAPA